MNKYSSKINSWRMRAFCNTCVHCLLPLSSFWDAIYKRKGWVTALSWAEPSGYTWTYKLAQTGAGGQVVFGIQWQQHPWSNNDISILGLNTTWERKMLKNGEERVSKRKAPWQPRTGEKATSGSVLVQGSLRQHFNCGMLFPYSHLMLALVRKATWPREN